MKSLLFFAATTFLGVATVQADTADYRHEVEQWRAARVARLTAPSGWLSLIGLAWLKPGDNRIGSAADNDIVVAAMPAHLGVASLRPDGSVHLALTGEGGALVDGKPLREAVMVDDMQAGEGAPTTVSLGSVSFLLIDREGRKGLRIKDSEAPTRRDFAGIDAFPVDPQWRIEASWVPTTGETLQMGTVIGTTETYPVPGRARFSRDGKTFEMLPVIEVPGDAQYFVVFADRTSGHETYGAARFLYIDPPQDGKVVLDFNKAYNPPCAFTAFATCPLAPAQNRLDLRVTAGEKTYRGGHAD